MFSAQVADEALVALRAVVQYGTGTSAALSNADVAGKTGTTENSVDAWFNGITPTLASSVWLGDPRGEVPMYVNGVEVFGADYPTQIWHDVMQYALSHVPYSAFPTPDVYDLPPVKYIFSSSLEEDDLLSHDGVGATVVCMGRRAGPVRHHHHDDHGAPRSPAGTDAVGGPVPAAWAPARNFRRQNADGDPGGDQAMTVTAADLEALLDLQDHDTRIDQELHRKAHLPERSQLAELGRGHRPGGSRPGPRSPHFSTWWRPARPRRSGS